MTMIRSRYELTKALGKRHDATDQDLSAEVSQWETPAYEVITTIDHAVIIRGGRKGYYTKPIMLVYPFTFDDVIEAHGTLCDEAFEKMREEEQDDWLEEDYIRGILAVR